MLTHSLSERSRAANSDETNSNSVKNTMSSDRDGKDRQSPIWPRGKLGAVIVYAMAIEEEDVLHGGLGGMRPGDAAEVLERLGPIQCVAMSPRGKARWDTGDRCCRPGFMVDGDQQSLTVGCKALGQPPAGDEVGAAFRMALAAELARRPICVAAGRGDEAEGIALGNKANGRPDAAQLEVKRVVASPPGPAIRRNIEDQPEVGLVKGRIGEELGAEVLGQALSDTGCDVLAPGLLLDGVHSQ